jgi:5-formyltetrahydrofolate cyclo-ligase
MLEEIKKLKEQYQNTENDTEISSIRKEMKSLFNDNPEAFAASMVLCMKDSNQKADEIVLRQKLEAVLPAISVSYLSKNYFKKTPQWFYQRLNGNKVNGKEAHFTSNELQTLSIALKEIGQKLSASASMIL